MINFLLYTHFLEETILDSGNSSFLRLQKFLQLKFLKSFFSDFSFLFLTSCELNSDITVETAKIIDRKSRNS